MSRRWHLTPPTTPPCARWIYSVASPDLARGLAASTLIKGYTSPRLDLQKRYRETAAREPGSLHVLQSLNCSCATYLHSDTYAGASPSPPLVVA